MDNLNQNPNTPQIQPPIPAPTGPKQWYKKSWFIAVVVLAVVAVAVSCIALTRKSNSEPVVINLNQKNPSQLVNEGDFKVWDDGTAYVKGEVVDHVSGCEVDNTCVLIVKAQNQNISLVYAAGEQQCPNTQAASWVNWGKNVNKGTIVKAYGAAGKVAGAGGQYALTYELTFCASKDYFILGADDPVPVGPYTEKFFNEVQQRMGSAELVLPGKVSLYLLMANNNPVLEFSAVVGGGCSQAQDLRTEETTDGDKIFVSILGYPPYQNAQDKNAPTCAMIAESRKQISVDVKPITVKGKQIIFKLGNKENVYNISLENNVLVLSPVNAPNVITVKFGENPPDKAIELRLNLSTNSSMPATLIEYEAYGGLCQYGGCSHKVIFYNNGEIRDETPVYDESSKVYVTKTTEKQMTTQELSDLAAKINNTNLEKVKQRKFEGTCPAAYDGQAMIYAVHKNQQTENLDSCQYILDQPLFQTINQLVVKYTYQ